MQKKLSVFLLAFCLLVGLVALCGPQAEAAETDIELKYDDRKDLPVWCRPDRMLPFDR